jgi:hypothetical protein
VTSKSLRNRAIDNYSNEHCTLTKQR